MVKQALLMLAAASIVAGALPANGQSAKVDRSKSSRALAALPRTQGEKPVVAIYEVRSAVPEITPKAATEMFMTALIKSGAFRVAERVRLTEGVGRERALATGGTTAAGGDISVPFTGARYVFEVVISEDAVGKSKRDNAFSVEGLQMGNKGNTDEIAIDIRITDVSTGLVLDAVNVVGKIETKSKQVTGVGGFANRILRKAGGRSVDADASLSSSRADGVDRAIRYCIETGVAELVRRFGKPQ